MIFKDYEIIALKRFLENIIKNPSDSQTFKREGKYLWCEDWKIIEILKCLFNGREFYLEDPPPNRLKDNPLWSKENIIQEAEALMEKCSNAEEIIHNLEKRRDSAGT